MAPLIKNPIIKLSLFVIASSLLFWQLIHTSSRGILQADDFVSYWASTKLLLRGENPYPDDVLFSMQKAEGWKQNAPLIAMGPPWTFAFLLPFGAMEYWRGRLAWFFISLALILFFVDWAWRYYGAPSNKRWISWIVGIFFYPVLFNLKIGQITPLLLLSVIGFLGLEKRRIYWWTGFAVVLFTIKPQAVFLFFMVFVFWAVSHRLWSCLSGLFSSLGIAAAVPLFFYSSIYSSYWQLGKTHVLNPGNPTWGSLFRITWGAQHLWLQFVPSFLGLVWVVWYWFKKRKTWNWSQETPLLLLVSQLTASYGWVYDQVLVLPALIQCVATIYRHPERPRWYPLVVLVYIGLNLVAMVLNSLNFTDIYFVWLAAGWWLLYLYCRKGNFKDIAIL